MLQYSVVQYITVRGNTVQYGAGQYTVERVCVSCSSGVFSSLLIQSEELSDLMLYGEGPPKVLV